MFHRRTAAPKWRLILVSHTHWDREWYLPFQLFRASLVEAVDTLLDLMATNQEYRYFTLDGQTIILEDYLEVRPEREAELRGLISEGRILIGPWYVMPDEFLVSGESLVRNLLEGRRTAAQFGSAMKVGYLPDPFGHTAQMPQILRGFGIDSAVLWRGTGARVTRNEAIWVAPDGSEVLMEQMPEGYDNAALLPTDPEALSQRLAHIRAELQPRATTRHLLLMNGDDHMLPQPEVPDIVSMANRKLRDAEVVHGTLPMLLSEIRQEALAAGVQWQRVEGEFRSPELAHILAGVLSSRMDIKQRNAACQTLLERWAEPFSAFASMMPRQVDHQVQMLLERLSSDAPSLLRIAWRYLLMNQPHDSISGCSADQVHREMVHRYDWCEQIAGLLATRALEALAQSLNTEIMVGDSQAQGAVAVFNSEAGPRTDFATCVAYLPGQTTAVALQGADGREVPCQVLREHHTDLASTTLSRSQLQGYLRLAGPGRSWPTWKLRILEKIVRAAVRGRMPELVLSGMDVVPGAAPSTVEVEVEAAVGKEHNFDALSAGMRQLSSLVDRGDAQHFRIRIRRRDQVEIGFVASDLPPHGGKLFRLVAAPSRPPAFLPQHDEVTLENEFISLQIGPEDGLARLIDRETGAIYWGINCLVDGGDAGDEYTYSPPTRDHIVRGPDEPPIITLEEHGPARQTARVELKLRLPVGLTEDRRERSMETVLCPVTSWLSVYPGVPRVDVRTVVTNRARDHRLRVLFPTQLEAEFSHADGQFAVIRRAIQAQEYAEGWAEHPATTHPQLAFVDISDGESGLLIANRGLPEYDVATHEGGPCIAITLLRCVGWLSRDDLATRQGAAGPLLETPDAQMLGTHVFEYSVIPHGGGWEDALHQAYWFARPLRALWTGRHPGQLGSEASFVSVMPSSLVMSAAKLAEDGSGHVILRLCNLREAPVEGLLMSHFPLDSVEITDLAENRGERLHLRDSRSVHFPVGAWQIATLRLAPADRPSLPG